MVGTGSTLSQYGSCALHSQVGHWVPSGNRAGNGGIAVILLEPLFPLRITFLAELV
jgi:hypothetical protein